MREQLGVGESYWRFIPVLPDVVKVARCWLRTNATWSNEPRFVRQRVFALHSVVHVVMMNPGNDESEHPLLSVCVCACVCRRLK